MASFCKLIYRTTLILYRFLQPLSSKVLAYKNLNKQYKTTSICDAFTETNHEQLFQEKSTNDQTNISFAKNM